MSWIYVPRLPRSHTLAGVAAGVIALAAPVVLVLLAWRCW